MYVYKPRRGMKRGEESKVRYYFVYCQLVILIYVLLKGVNYKRGIRLAVVL